MLLKNNCEEVILETQSEIIYDIIKDDLIASRFDDKSLTTSILIKKLRDEKNRRRLEFIKTMSIIHELIAECHYSLIDNKNVVEM